MKQEKRKIGIKVCFSIMRVRKRMYFAMVALDAGLTYAADILFALLNRGVVNSVTALDFHLFMISLWFGVSALIFYTGDIFSRFYKIKAIRHIMRDIRCRLFRHMEFLPVDYYEKNHSADSIYRLNSNVENMKRAYTNSFPNIVRAIFGGGASCVFILALDARLGLVSIITCVITFIVNIRFTVPLRRLGKEIQRSESALLARLSDLLAGFRIIKLFDIDGRSVKKYEDANNTVAGKRIKRISKMGALSSVDNLLIFLNNFVLITIGAVMAALGFCDFGTVFAILSVQGNVSSMLMTFGNSWGMMQESAAAAELIDEILCRDRETRAPLIDRNADTDRDYIKFENVEFTYDDKRGRVLRGLSLTADEGKVTALAGPSGGGKSTTLKLLLGFYRNNTGKIYFAHRNINSYSLEELRDKISYVPQDAYLFDTTVRENISYGRPGASDEEIIAAAKASGAHDFITNMPKGYDSRVGERGESLSGGQRQRIAIARAFLKNAPILLLDEATSALDTENERVVQKSIEALMKGRTVIMIAHRLSTIEKADRIYVLERGRVAQSGTHEELKNIPGTYSNLVKLAN